MTNNDVFTPNPDEIKTIVVADFYGRTQTYSSLVSAITAVYQLPQGDMKSVEEIIKRNRGTEGD